MMEHYPWLLTAWLIGVPFVLGVVEFVRIEGLKKTRVGLDRRANSRESGTVAGSRY